MGRKKQNRESETRGSVDYELYPHQYRSLELAAAHPITFISGGVRNGKTRAAIAWCMSRSGWGPFGKLPPPGKPRVGWIVVPTITSMWSNVRPEWEAMLGFVEDGGLILSQKLAPEHTYIIQCPDGIPMTWYVKSAEYPDRLRAASVWAIWMTEAAMNEHDVYMIAQQRVISGNGTIFMETSPFGINWFVKEVVERAHHVEDWRPQRKGLPPLIERKGDDNRIAGLFGVPIEANESLTPEAVRALRAGASAEVARREYDGEFFSWEGQIWKCFDPKKHVLKANPTDEDLEGCEIIAGMDFGWEHPFGHLWAAKKGNTIIILDEYRVGGQVLREHAKALRANSYNQRVTWRYADPSAAQARAEMADYKVGSSPAENDVELGINCVAQMFESGNLFIAPRCGKLIEEIHGYHRDQKTLKIVKKIDDLVDPLRYLCYSDRVHGGGMTLPHLSPNAMGRMVLQSDSQETIDTLAADDCMPMSDGVGEDFNFEDSQEIV